MTPFTFNYDEYGNVLSYNCGCLVYNDEHSENCWRMCEAMVEWHHRMSRLQRVRIAKRNNMLDANSAPVEKIATS